MCAICHAIYVHVNQPSASIPNLPGTVLPQTFSSRKIPLPRNSPPAKERQADPGHDETPVCARAPTALCTQRPAIPADGPSRSQKSPHSTEWSDRIGDHRCPWVRVSDSLVGEERPEPCRFTCHLLFAARMTIFIPRHDEQPGVLASLCCRIGRIGLDGEQVPAERAFRGFE